MRADAVFPRWTITPADTELLARRDCMGYN